MLKKLLRNSEDPFEGSLANISSYSTTLVWTTSSRTLNGKKDSFNTFSAYLNTCSWMAVSKGVLESQWTFKQCQKTDYNCHHSSSEPPRDSTQHRHMGETRWISDFWMNQHFCRHSSIVHCADSNWRNQEKPQPAKHPASYDCRYSIYCQYASTWPQC